MATCPLRIVSLFPAATEIVCGIGLHDRLVGVSHECNWPPTVAPLPRLTRSRIDSSADSGAIDAQVKRVATAGQPLYELDVARLLELRPDLIVAQAQCDVCAVSVEAVTAAVRTHPGLSAAQVLALNPRSLGDVLADVERLGVAAGAANEALAYAGALRERIDAMQRPAGTNPVRSPRVVVIEWIEPLMIAGNWTPELVALAGGEYGLATAGAPSRYVTWREVVDYAPEVVVVAPCGFDLTRSRREAGRLERLPGWDDLPATRLGQVYVVDGDAYLNRPGPRLVDSLEWLAAQLRAMIGALKAD